MAFNSKLALAILGAAVAVSSTAGARENGTVTFSGDAGFRVERDMRFQTPLATTDEFYTRVRFRLLADAQINDALSAFARVATGDTYTQDFVGGSTGFGSRQAFNLNLAYLHYKAADTVALQLGKVPVAFWTAGSSVTGTMWNPDQSFEGAQVKWAGDMGTFKPYATVTYANVAHRLATGSTAPSGAATGTGADVDLLGVQVGSKFATDLLTGNVAIGSYSYSNVKGLTAPAAYAGYNGTAGARGNTLTGGAYAYEYQELAVDAEVSYSLGFAPLGAFGGYYTNANGDQKNGLFGGLKLGALKDVGTWHAAVVYKDFGRDAFLANYAESIDSFGGGTGFRGFEYQAAYQAWQNASVVAKYQTSNHEQNGGGSFQGDIYALELNANF